MIACDGKKEEKEEEEEEDDWMPPPPKFDANAKRKLAEDPALKELRYRLDNIYVPTHLYAMLHPEPIFLIF